MEKDKHLKAWINPTKKWLIAHLKKKRKHLKKSQQDYADYLRISLESYQKFERYPEEFSMDKIFYVLTALGFEPEIVLHEPPS